MPRLPDTQRLLATRRFQATIANVIDRATPALHRAWDALDSIDEESVAVLTTGVTPTMAAVKQAAVRSATGYYSILSGARPPSILAAEIPTIANMRDPFISVWQSLAAGNDYTDALLAGRARIEAVVSDFAVSTTRQTGGVFVAKTGRNVGGWERIPDAGACDWCQDVAGQTYYSAETADFGHSRCACTAAPIFE